MGVPALAAIPIVGDILEKGLDILFPDPQKKAEAAALLTNAENLPKLEAMKTQASIIIAEAQGESWLQRNWRPGIMVVFAFIVFNNYVLAPYLSMLFSTKVPTLVLTDQMWELLNLGIGGYVALRSVEKVTDSVTSAIKTKHVMKTEEARVSATPENK